MNDSIIPATWNLQARLHRFESSAVPVECAEVALAVNLSVENVTFGGASWNMSCNIRPVAERPDAVDGVLSCRVMSGRATEVNAAIELVLSDWDGANFVLVPAAAYNGNRYPVRVMRYPPIVSDPGDLGPDAPRVITDVPRLETDPAVPSCLHLNTGDTTTPCLAFYSPAGNYACILLTDQGGVFGNHGLQVREDAGRRRAVLAIEAPCVRPQLYRMMNRALESWDRGVTVNEGDALVIRFRLFRFPATEVQALYDRFAEVRKDLSGPVTLKHMIPFSAAWEIQEEKYNRENWHPDGFYTVATHQHWAHKYCQWQLGWTGGGIVTLPLLQRGNPDSRQRALRNLDWVFKTATSPAGMPYGMFNTGRPHGDSHRTSETTRWVFVRRLGDWLYFACKQIDLLQKQDPTWTPPAAWVTGLRRLADGLIGVFDRYGQLGQFLEWETWEIVVGGSTAGAMVPGGLALAAVVFREPRYREAAERMARHFIERDLRAGVTTGGPGEILQSPDSESAFALLESLVTLYETTADRAWLIPAEAMARQCLTWCASYDYQFPASSWFGRLGMRAAGSVWANVQNKHSSPGICTLSGDSLFKLWRATGREIYLDQIRETAHNHAQYLSRADRIVGEPDKMPPGYMCERVNFSDWEGRENIGGCLFGSCWSEVSLMLTAVEIPGIYVQPDIRRVVVFDHVDVVALAPESSGGMLRLQIANPTKFDANVTVLIESSTDAREQPLGPNALHGAPAIEVRAGQTVEWTGSLNDRKSAAKLQERGRTAPWKS
jgi:hypothetical protein